MKTVLKLTALLLITACGGTMNGRKSDRVVEIVSPKEYSRDSTFISYTVKQFVINKYREYDVDSYTEGATIYVDTIIYSPNKLKLFSLTILEKEKGEEGKPFKGRAIIAYREDQKEIWKVYPIRNLTGGGYDYNGVQKILRDGYFKGLNETSTDGHKYKYTPIEDKFWEDLFFKKGYDVDSLYFFQTELNPNTPTLKTKRDGIIPLLKIDYPKELLEQFESAE